MRLDGAVDLAPSAVDLLAMFCPPEIQESCPPDDRTPERRVFAGFSPDVAKHTMARACVVAGVPHFSPHDLRHRYASVKIAEGVPVTELAAQLGHSRTSMTLDVYSHVLVDEQR